MNFDELRKKYESIIYHGFSVNEEEASVIFTNVPLNVLGVPPPVDAFLITIVIFCGSELFPFLYTSIVPSVCSDAAAAVVDDTVMV